MFSITANAATIVTLVRNPLPVVPTANVETSRAISPECEELLAEAFAKLSTALSSGKPEAANTLKTVSLVCGLITSWASLLLLIGREVRETKKYQRELEGKKGKGR